MRSLTSRAASLMQLARRYDWHKLPARYRHWVMLARAGVHTPLRQALNQSIAGCHAVSETPNTTRALPLLRPKCKLCHSRLWTRGNAFYLSEFGRGQSQPLFAYMSASWAHRECLSNWAERDAFIVYFNATCKEELVLGRRGAAPDGEPHVHYVREAHLGEECHGLLGYEEIFKAASRRTRDDA